MRNKDYLFIIIIVLWLFSIFITESMCIFCFSYINIFFIIILGILTILEVKNYKFFKWLNKKRN